MNTNQLYDLFLKCNGVSTDTRSIKKNSLFFSLKGENFDGNDYALEALNKGAKYAVIDNNKLKNSKFIQVNDVLTSLQLLSACHRTKLKNTTIIALTGSNGKTTTKELIHSVLSEKYKTVSTLGNLNNHIGVPLSLLKINKDSNFAVIEMGANHIGEIKTLCEIAMPDFGLITNYGHAHLEGFGGFEGVVKGKSEMFDYLTQNYGHIILNNDDLIQIENCKGDLAITFGEKEDSEFIYKYKKEEDILIIQNDDDKYKCEIYGDYNFSNIAASITIGKFLDLSSSKIHQGLISFKNDSNRSEVINYGNNKLYLDAYNDNPTSMKAAISNFENNIINNKILILGDMFELGNYSSKEHQKIIDFIDKKDYLKVYLVGENFFDCQTQSKYFEKFKSTEEMSKSVKLIDFNLTNILIKGSRGIGLEKLIKD